MSLEGDLAGRGVSLLIITGFGADMNRFGEEGARQRDDGPRHRGRKEHGLVRISVQKRENLLDIRQKAQVQHFICFIQDEDTDLVKRQVLLLAQIEKTSRCAHDDVRASFNLFNLFLVRPAAAQRNDVERQVCGGYLEVITNLDSQLARRSDYQRSGSAIEFWNIGIVEDPIQQWDAKAIGLAHTGAGLTNEVLTAERDGKSQFLDGKSMRDSTRSQGIADFCRDS